MDVSDIGYPISLLSLIIIIKENVYVNIDICAPKFLSIVLCVFGLKVQLKQCYERVVEEIYNLRFPGHFLHAF